MTLAANMAPKADARFASLSTDPKYRLPSTKNARVQVDDRFSRMFKDQDFTRKARVDRYGRKIAKSATDDKERKVLNRLYRTEKDASSAKKQSTNDAESDEESMASDAEIEAELQRLDGKLDPARQGGFEESSSSEDSSSDEDEVPAVAEDAEAEMPDQVDGDVPLGDASSRLAVVNLDWDNIRASDILAVAQSFATSNTGVRDVKIYPSEFGKERIEKEELDGPPKEAFSDLSTPADAPAQADTDSDDENTRIKDQLLQPDDGREYESASLRKYQLQRLRYYFAVISCTSTDVAKTLYDAMDGREYLSSANFFDMRYIPDEITFDDPPRDECTHLPASYRPNEFVTDALTHSKVKLTWDNDDTTRKEVQKRAFSRAEIEENDLKAYIGGDSSDESQDDGSTDKKNKAEEQRLKMRAALGLSEKPEKATRKKDEPLGDMQVTFTSGLSTAAKGESVFENEPILEETTVEKYKRKEKERKARRKENSKNKNSEDSADATKENAKDVMHTKATDESKPDAKVDDKDTFEDPFFADDPAISARAEKSLRKAERTKKAAERAATEASATAEREKLQHLMLDDAQDEMRHFDMHAVIKAEKDAGKKSRLKQRKRDKLLSLREDDGANGATAAQGTSADQGDFQIETQDPRFASLFQSHEYAIDPSSAKFSGTKGMKALLQAGREKRKRADDEDALPSETNVKASSKKDKKRKSVEESQGDIVSVKQLLTKVKRNKL